MQGIVTRVFPYTKKGTSVEKALVNVLSVETGATDVMYLTKEQVEEKGLAKLVLTKEDLQELADKYETIDYSPASSMASF
jgi:hypothetical protein